MRVTSTVHVDLLADLQHLDSQSISAHRYQSQCQKVYIALYSAAIHKSVYHRSMEALPLPTHLLLAVQWLHTPALLAQGEAPTAYTVRTMLLVTMCIQLLMMNWATMVILTTMSTACMHALLAVSFEQHLVMMMQHVVSHRVAVPWDYGIVQFKELVK